MSEQNENKKEHRHNTFLIITIIFISIAIVVGICIGLYMLFNNSNKQDSTKTDIVEEDKEVSNNENNEIVFNNYKFILPEGARKESNGEYNYIVNNDHMFVYVTYPVSCEKIIEYKDTIISTLNNQGYNVDNFEIKEQSDKHYILAKGKLNGIEYGFIFYDIDKDFTIYTTISSNTLGLFNDKWFDDTLEFIKTGTKIELEKEE